MRYRRKVAEVVATQYTETQSHPAIVYNHSVQDFGIETDFGQVQINFGDWVVEINGKIKVLKDEYFKEHYEVIPEKVQRPKLVIVSDCD